MIISCKGCSYAPYAAVAIYSNPSAMMTHTLSIHGTCYYDYIIPYSDYPYINLARTNKLRGLGCSYAVRGSGNLLESFRDDDAAADNIIWKIIILCLLCLFHGY
eukprot:4736050-Pleurochrysis_carterae.AAC.1